MRYDEALVDINTAMQISLTYRNYFTRGNIYLALNKVELAIIDFDKSLELEPGDFMTCHSKGLAFSKLNNFQGAIDMFKAALSINAKHIPS